MASIVPGIPSKDGLASIVEGHVDAHLLLENILESSTEYSIIAIDGDRHILTWNAGARRNYGYEPQEILGKSADVLHEEKDLGDGTVARMMDEALRTGRALGTLRRRRKDGSTFIASVVVTRRDEREGPPGFLVISRDITAEERLRREADNDRRLLDNILASSTEYSIIAKDLDRRILTWNAGAQRNYGYRPEEIIGQKGDVLHDKRDLESNAIETMHDRALRFGQAEGIFHRRRKDGSVFTASVVLTRRVDATGRPIGYLLVSRDVTAEEAMRRAADEDRRRLVEADRRKDEFLATLGHELRNPLAPLAMAVNILARKDASPEAKQRQVAVLERQVKSLSRLVADLLDAARMSRDRVEIRRERCDLNEVLEQGIDVARPLIEERRHHLVVRSDGPVQADIDRVRVAQAVGNLVLNAAKYTPAGGRIEVSLATQGNLATVRVSDTGAGIPATELSNIWDPFVQAHTHSARGGLGLGLTVVRKIALLHGGRAFAQSAGPGQGSTFTFEIPFGSAEAAAPAESGAARVLVCDDVADVADSLAEVLRLEGFDARATHSGADCIAQAMAWRPHAVVCDIAMPDVDGLQVAREVRAAMPEVKLLALSGHALEADRERSREAGFDHHFAKPADIRALVALLPRLTASPSAGT